MSSLSLSEMEKLAKEVTAGPWHTHTHGQGADVRSAARHGGSQWIAECATTEGAEFIAAMNPQTALALIEVARRAKALFANMPAENDSPLESRVRKALEPFNE